MSRFDIDAVRDTISLDAASTDRHGRSSERRALADQRGKVSLGRVSENRIPINDLSVSRRHCVIVRQGEAYLLRDLDSHNGTFVNGVPVEEHYLEDGDRIDVGRQLVPVPADASGDLASIERRWCSTPGGRR